VSETEVYLIASRSASDDGRVFAFNMAILKDGQAWTPEAAQEVVDALSIDSADIVTGANAVAERDARQAFRNANETGVSKKTCTALHGLYAGEVMREVDGAEEIFNAVGRALDEKDPARRAEIVYAVIPEAKVASILRLMGTLTGTLEKAAEKADAAE
jgi:hypothetical protein